MADQAPVAEAPKQEIAKRTETITSPAQFEQAIAKWTGHYNLLTPFTQITGLAHKHGIIASVVKINPDPRKGGPGEVYDGLPFLNDGEVALAKIGLRKIAEGAGISITTERTDPYTIANYWSFKAIATYRGIDGTIVRREATAEWDLRDGSPRLNGWKPAQVSEGRKNGLRNAETRAINAAIREFGIKQKYHQRELEKPFLVLRCAWQPDPNDPNDMRVLAESSMRGTSTLYPASAPPAQPIHEGEVVDPLEEPRTVGSSSIVETKPDPNKPPTPDAVRVTAVDKKPGEKKALYTVTDSKGRKATTRDASIGEAAMKAHNDKYWVELVIEVDGDARELVEIAPVVADSKLPKMENL